MKEKILNLEKSLFKYEYMSNIEYLDYIIDDTYEEIGKSGSIYNKNDVIKELSNLKEDRDIEIYNFKCNKISNNIWLVHYITKSNDKNIYRTSIWREEESLKILFHQASEYKENIELEKY